METILKNATQQMGTGILMRKTKTVGRCEFKYLYSEDPALTLLRNIATRYKVNDLDFELKEGLASFSFRFKYLENVKQELQSLGSQVIYLKFSK